MGWFVEGMVAGGAVSILERVIDAMASAGGELLAASAAEEAIRSRPATVAPGFDEFDSIRTELTRWALGPEMSSIVATFERTGCDLDGAIEESVWRTTRLRDLTSEEEAAAITRDFVIAMRRGLFSSPEGVFYLSQQVMAQHRELVDHLDVIRAKFADVELTLELQPLRIDELAVHREGVRTDTEPEPRAAGAPGGLLQVSDLRIYRQYSRHSVMGKRLWRVDESRAFRVTNFGRGTYAGRLPTGSTSLYYQSPEYSTEIELAYTIDGVEAPIRMESSMEGNRLRYSWSLDLDLQPNEAASIQGRRRFAVPDSDASFTWAPTLPVDGVAFWLAFDEPVEPWARQGGVASSRVMVAEQSNAVGVEFNGLVDPDTLFAFGWNARPELASG